MYAGIRNGTGQYFTFDPRLKANPLMTCIRWALDSNGTPLTDQPDFSTIVHQTEWVSELKAVLKYKIKSSTKDLTIITYSGQALRFLENLWKQRLNIAGFIPPHGNITLGFGSLGCRTNKQFPEPPEVAVVRQMPTTAPRPATGIIHQQEILAICLPGQMITTEQLLGFFQTRIGDGRGQAHMAVFEAAVAKCLRYDPGSDTFSRKTDGPVQQHEILAIIPEGKMSDPKRFFTHFGPRIGNGPGQMPTYEFHAALDKTLRIHQNVMKLSRKPTIIQRHEILELCPEGQAVTASHIADNLPGRIGDGNGQTTFTSFCIMLRECLKEDPATGLLS